MIILGIETSCDESSVALVRDGQEVLANEILSQVSLHERYGGVVPELACRAHQEALLPLIDRALAQANLTMADVDALAVTHGPGLIGALMVGLSLAKGLALSHNLPLIGVNHIEGHLYANCLQEGSTPLEFPFVGLIVSGGHTQLNLVKAWGQYETLGQTIDDAVGEAYDKVAKMMDLGYPGGPVVDRLAAEGQAMIDFPRPYLSKDSLDFSFSGLKTAVLYYLRDRESSQWPVKDVCASFQAAVVDVLERKSFEALKRTGAKHLIVGGGVALNSELRKRFAQRAEAENVYASFPGFALCADNAGMIAGLAYEYYKAGHKCAFQEFDAEPSLALSSW